MEYAIGVAAAVAVGLFASVIGFDVEKAERWLLRRSYLSRLS